jgi:hypothetical protein
VECVRFKRRIKNQSWKSEYKINDQGNLIESYIYDLEGELEAKYTYKYNEENHKIEYNRYSSSGQLQSEGKHTYEYDNKGNWIKQVTFVDGEPKSVTERTIEYSQFPKHEVQ